MNDSKEKISAFLDDDLGIEELGSISPHGMQTDADESGLALRYQLIGDAMRGEVSDASMIDVSVQLREALRNEPQGVTSPVRHETSQSRHPFFDFNAWLAPFMKPLGGLAVAASVALVTVIAVTQVDTDSDPSAVLADANNQQVNIPVVAIVSKSAPRAGVTTVVVNNNGNAKRNAAYLDAYLAEHAEFAAQDTMQGRMPYARTAIYESE